MPTECLILRRVFPVPVTFADLRRAYEVAFAAYGGGTCRAEMERQVHRSEHRPNAAKNARVVLASIHTDWHSAIKEATGAVDEVYAVIDGREVRIATVKSGEVVTTSGVCAGWSVTGSAIDSLLIAADEAGYWQRPHEVRVDLEESQMSHKTMARIAANSIAAGSK